MLRAPRSDGNTAHPAGDCAGVRGGNPVGAGDRAADSQSDPASTHKNHSTHVSQLNFRYQDSRTTSPPIP